MMATILSAIFEDNKEEESNNNIVNSIIVEEDTKTVQKRKYNNYDAEQISKDEIHKIIRKYVESRPKEVEYRSEGEMRACREYERDETMYHWFIGRE